MMPERNAFKFCKRIKSMVFKLRKHMLSNRKEINIFDTWIFDIVIKQRLLCGANICSCAMRDDDTIFHQVA